MKKIMLFVAAIAMAFSVNAAAVSWTTGSMSEFGISKNDTGYTANIYFYTLTESIYSDVTANFGSGTQVSDSQASKMYAYEGVTADTMASGTYYAEIIITRTSDNATLTSAKGEFAYDSTALSNSTLNFTSGNGFTTVENLWADSSWQTSGGGGGIPEPTSGLLLLIGGSLLALRRKQK